MPVAIPVIAAVAAAATASAVAAVPLGVLFGGAALGLAEIGVTSSLVGSLAGFVVASAITVIGSRAFSPSSKASPFSNLATDPQSRATMVRSPVETHKIIYGEAKVSGPIVYIGTTDSGPVPSGGPMTGTNLMLHMVIALAGHEVEEIGTVYFNDKPVTTDANGYVNNIPYSYLPATPPPNTQTVSTAVRTDEVVTVTTGAAHGFAAGDQVTMTVTTDLSMNGDFVIASVPSSTTFSYANGGPNASASGGTAADNTISTSVNSYARIKRHLGAVGQEADPDLIAEVPGWDVDHKLNGIAYLYVRLQYSQDVFGHGIPNVSAVVKGKKVFDPRDSSTAWTDNAALCTRDYLASDYGFNCSDAEINDTYFSAAANVCDEAVTLTTGGSQARYTCNGVIDTANAPVENLNALVAAMAGTVTYVQGMFRGYAGAFESTAGDLTTDMLAGDDSVQTRPPRQQLFNAVQGTFIDPSLNYSATDFPPVVNSTYVAADGGTQMFKDIQLPFTTHPEAAQRIAKVILEQGRQGIQVELTLNHHAIPFAVWDTVTYTDPAYGWDHKVFRVKKYSTAGIGPVVLSLQEESSASYDWDSGEATVLDPAPDTTLPNPFFVAVPTGLSFNSRATEATGGVTVYNLSLSWALHPDAFVQHGGRIEVQYKLHSDTDWRPSYFVNGDLTFTDLPTSSINTSYDIRIRAVSSLGANVRSAWVELDNCIVGSSGGVGVTNDWGDFTHSPGPTPDWGNFTTSPGSTDDWGFFT